MCRSRFAVLVAALVLLTGAGAGAQGPALRWYRGNTHTHTLNSDGDTPPDGVVRWYRERGYHFVVITDHEFITDVGPLNALFGAAGRFLVISGQEVTQRVADSTHPERLRQAHLNALGVTRVVRPTGDRNIATGTTIAATYATNLPAIRAAGGVPQVNHPNFRWSVPMDQMLALPDSTLFELWNGHPTVYNHGGADSAGVSMPSTEALWDSLLGRGRLLFGVADDDSHHFRPQDAENPDMARPGRGWVMVRADTLTSDAILRALARGDFYSSTGITLRDLQAGPREIRIEIAAAGDRRYLTEFIGHGGAVLAAVPGTRAQYRITGREGYVRARVTDSSGRRAWTQPVVVRP
ncbi:MAG TPA: CehA/McbA family metallohydrolase [Gemmatimonadaceae bacterium]|nr:CehA/McbA family metallohydrolase [Gemmatimonadaceae bacterium]